jgi:RNA polymerase sigma-70 factor, ECF subfamily
VDVAPCERPPAGRSYRGKKHLRHDANHEMTALATYPRPSMTDDSEAWLRRLRGPAAERDAAVADLHALLLRAAHHELSRRQVAGPERDDLAVQAAGDALVAVLAKLDTFRGASRFTTWAYKFALLEAGVKARRRAWQGREIPLADDAWGAFADPGPSAHDSATTGELLRAIRTAVETELTDHQREVFVALALQEVPIDVLAERRSTTRGALYKTLHDARRRLRAALADHDLGAIS